MQKVILTLIFTFMSIDIAVARSSGYNFNDFFGLYYKARKHAKNFNCPMAINYGRQFQEYQVKVIEHGSRSQVRTSESIEKALFNDKKYLFCLDNQNIIHQDQSTYVKVFVNNQEVDFNALKLKVGDTVNIQWVIFDTSGTGLSFSWNSQDGTGYSDWKQAATGEQTYTVGNEELLSGELDVLMRVKNADGIELLGNGNGDLLEHLSIQVDGEEPKDSVKFDFNITINNSAPMSLEEFYQATLNIDDEIKINVLKKGSSETRHFFMKLDICFGSGPMNKIESDQISYTHKVTTKDLASNFWRRSIYICAQLKDDTRFIEDVDVLRLRKRIKSNDRHTLKFMRLQVRVNGTNVFDERDLENINHPSISPIKKGDRIQIIADIENLSPTTMQYSFEEDMRTDWKDLGGKRQITISITADENFVHKDSRLFSFLIRNTDETYQELNNEADLNFYLHMYIEQGNHPSAPKPIDMTTESLVLDIKRP